MLPVSAYRTESCYEYVVKSQKGVTALCSIQVSYITSQQRSVFRPWLLDEFQLIHAMKIVAQVSWNLIRDCILGDDK